MSEQTSRLIALYGGTFDPIHYGHLKPVEAMAKAAALSRVIILPNNVPPHRPQPAASSEQRKNMVALAVKGNPLFQIDCRELNRTTPSWTVETLESFRRDYGNEQPLAFIIGQDSLLTLHRWHRHEALLSLCHLLVCRRPGYALKMANRQRQQWLEAHTTQNPSCLHTLPAGKIFLADTPEYAISATAIRERIARGDTCTDALPAAVRAYITQEKLYRTLSNEAP